MSLVAFFLPYTMHLWFIHILFYLHTHFPEITFIVKPILYVCLLVVIFFHYWFVKTLVLSSGVVLDYINSWSLPTSLLWSVAFLFKTAREVQLHMRPKQTVFSTSVLLNLGLSSFVNSVDPYQMASDEAIWSGSTPVSTLIEIHTGSSVAQL